MTSPQFTMNTLIDSALRAAMYSVIREPRVDRASVTNILEIFSGESDANAAITLTIAYVLRQEARGEINKDASKELVKMLLEIREKGGEEKGELARKFLGYYKWLFEIIDKWLFSILEKNIPKKMRPKNDLRKIPEKKLLAILNKIGLRIDLEEIPKITFKDFLEKYMIPF